eukprot:gene21683-20462_t
MDILGLILLFNGLMDFSLIGLGPIFDAKTFVDLGPLCIGVFTSLKGVTNMRTRLVGHIFIM